MQVASFYCSQLIFCFPIVSLLTPNNYVANYPHSGHIIAVNRVLRHYSRQEQIFENTLGNYIMYLN